MVSNNSKVETVEVREKPKPAMVHSYNQFVNGCDRADQNLGYYGLQGRKSVKWWKRLYFWALEIVHVNAFVLYKIMNNPTPQQLRSAKFSLKGFKEAILTGLVNKYIEEAGLTNNPLEPPTQGMALPGRPEPLRIKRLTEKQHLIRHTENDSK
ncbi:transposase [Elysia marginata]|uniref:Transposase n=1 Tax=Elysia marginata TaxID=1093978 RepID=A0AAV4FNN1_9GAST|nr:transposase [Elysia marginata]